MQKERIAIIGVGCRFPGGVSSKDSLWKLLSKAGKASLKCHPIAGTWSDIMMLNRA
jgi:Polyketide synthase modules and related proteins